MNIVSVWKIKEEDFVYIKSSSEHTYYDDPEDMNDWWFLHKDLYEKVVVIYLPVIVRRWIERRITKGLCIVEESYL